MYARLIGIVLVFVSAAALHGVVNWSRHTGRAPSGTPETSVICASATTDLGGGSCPATEFGQHIILGDGR